MRDNNSLKKLIPTDLAEDYAQAGADLVEHAKHFVPALDNLGTEIPYVKTVVAAIKFPKTLSDILLGRKVYAFLYASNLDEEKLKKFCKKFSKTKQERLWEQVVLSINSHDDKRKSEIIGKLFSALVDGYLEEEEFFALVHATNTLNLGLLESLKQIYMLSDGDGPALKAAVYYTFANVGLIDINNGAIGTTGGGGPHYPLNQLGWKYIGVAFDFPPSNITGMNVGVGELISEIGDNGIPTNRAYPLDYFKQTGKRYGEVEIFLLNSGNQVLCEEDTLYPAIMYAAPIPAGMEALDVAHSLIDEDMTHLRPILIRNSEDGQVQKCAFTAVEDIQLSHTFWKDFHQVRQEIMSSGDYDDQKRYLLAVTEQMERYISGDLADRV